MTFTLSSRLFSGFHLGLPRPTYISQTWNMPMTQFSFPALTLMRLLHLLQYLALRIGLSLSILPSANSLPSMGIFLSLCLRQSLHFRPVPVSTVPLPLLILLITLLYCHLLRLYFLPNIWVLSSLQLLPPPQILSSVAPRLLLPSSSLNNFSDILLSPNVFLRTYSSIVQSILLHGMESQTFSPAQVAKIDALHYKALRHIFQIKSPYYHRVLQPSDADCSNEYLQNLSYQILPTVIPNSLRISDLHFYAAPCF